MVSQSKNFIHYAPSCISEEKYKVARLIQSSYSFSIPDILESPNSPSIRDATYAVMGELLDKGLVADTGQYDISNEDKLVKVYRVVHKKLDERGNYRLDSEKYSEFESYIEQLDYSRVQPDSRGKPRSLSFRVAEKLLDEVKNPPKDQTDEMRESLLISFHRYLGLAQMEETTKELSTTCQAAISEAYIRNLYAEYLIIKDPEQWSSAIAQLLKSAKLFDENSVFDMQRLCESRACEILIKQFTSLSVSSLDYSISKLLDFAQETDNLVKALSVESLSMIFQFVYRKIFSEIEHQVDFLCRSTGELSQATNRGWTISGRYETPLTSPAYELLNQARWMLINSGRSQDNRLAAKEQIEQAKLILEGISPQLEKKDVALLRYLLNDHLQAITLSLDLSEVSGVELSQKLASLSRLNFEGILPFYWADTLKQVISAVSGLTSRVESSLPLERQVKKLHSSDLLELSTSEPELEDYGYTITDFDDLRTGLKNQSVNSTFKEKALRSGENNINYQTLEPEYIPTTSENISKGRSILESNLNNVQLRDSHSSLLSDEEMRNIGDLRNTSSIEQHPITTMINIRDRSYANESEFDFLRMLNLPEAKQVVLSKS